MYREVNFRTLQAVADLRALAVGAGAGVLARIAPGTEALVHRHGCRLGADAATLALIEPVERAVADPDADFPACIAATAILLADALQGGLDPRGLVLTRALVAERFRALPRPHRAVLANGFEAPAKGFHQRPYPAPDPAERIGADRDAVLDALAALARRATEADLVAISRADYGCGAERHLTALRQVIGAQDCRMTPDQLWYPSEAIELTAHVPSATGFLPATALLMIASIENGDERGDMEFRWANNAAAYLVLPPAEAAPILAGFRHLYEAIDVWSPYWQALFDVAENRAIAIPLACGPLPAGPRDDEETAP